MDFPEAALVIAQSKGVDKAIILALIALLLTKFLILDFL
jgi:hypothetical protein